MDWTDSSGPTNFHGLPVGADPSGAFWPNDRNDSQPFLQLAAKPARTRVLDTAELIRKSERAEQRNLVLRLCAKASVAKANKQVQNARGIVQHADCLKVRGNRMRHQFTVELIAEHDGVFETFGRREIVRVAVVPDLRFPKEIEPRCVDDLRGAQLRIRTEEDRGAENSFERTDQSSILFAAFVHPECLKHLGGGSKTDSLALLTNSQSGEEDRNDAILPEGETVIGVTGHLKNKVTVAPFI